MKLGPLIACVLSAPAFGQVYATQFDDDMGWTLTGNHPSCAFHVDGTPSTMSDGAFFSPPFSLNANNGPCDDIFNDTFALSPPIDISNLQQPVLRFQCNWDFAQDNFCRYVRVTNDGLSTYVMEQCLTLSDCAPYTWHAHELALDPAWGTIQLEFNMQISAWLFTAYPGWFIDDLIVEESCGGPPTVYCATATNSSGLDARISYSGSQSVAAADLRLHVTDCPPNQFTIFFMGQAQTEVPFADGWLCVAGQIWRYDVTSTGSAGVPSQSIDMVTSPSTLITVGSTWDFQNWFRDPQGPGGTGSNLSNALEVLFCP